MIKCCQEIKKVKKTMKKYVTTIIGMVAFIATIGLVTAGYGSVDRERERESYIEWYIYL